MNSAQRQALLKAAPIHMTPKLLKELAAADFRAVDILPDSLWFEKLFSMNVSGLTVLPFPTAFNSGLA